MGINNTKNTGYKVFLSQNQRKQLYNSKIPDFTHQYILTLNKQEHLVILQMNKQNQHITRIQPDNTLVQQKLFYFQINLQTEPHQLFLYGGISQQTISSQITLIQFNTNTLNTTTTTTIHPQTIIPPFYNGMAIHINSTIYLGGGNTGDNQISNRFFKVTLNIKPSKPPHILELSPFQTRREGGQMIHYKGHIYLFAGYNSLTRLSLIERYSLDPSLSLAHTPWQNLDFSLFTPLENTVIMKGFNSNEILVLGG
jgi:hypothetical protein